MIMMSHSLIQNKQRLKEVKLLLEQFFAQRGSSELDAN